MKAEQWEKVLDAEKAALQVLKHNAKGPYQGLPRTAGWGYPEPYTRDLMFSIFGIGVSGDRTLIISIRKVLQRLARNQTEHGHITSLVHTKNDRGASDCTPLFLLGVGIYRQFSGESNFLAEAVSRALTWMVYQSPSDRYLIAQQPTSDWRDEQWVLGYGLYVNTLMYSALCLLGESERARLMLKEMKRFTITEENIHQHVHEGLLMKNKPYYAFWSYKVYSSERFDLLGNSLAILSGIASLGRSREIATWVEEECRYMRQKGELSVELPPNFFPFVVPGDPDWHKRYSGFNLPGNYHNGGIWPFICAFYVAALVAAGQYKLAENKLHELTKLVTLSANKTLKYGFNEWVAAPTGAVMGQDWQTWSAAIYLYAVTCVRKRTTPFFDTIRSLRMTGELLKTQKRKPD